MSCGLTVGLTMVAAYAHDMRISILHRRRSWGGFANDFALSVLRFIVVSWLVDVVAVYGGMAGLDRRRCYF
jgi:hypothetical protein